MHRRWTEVFLKCDSEEIAQRSHLKEWQKYESNELFQFRECSITGERLWQLAGEGEYFKMGEGRAEIEMEQNGESVDGDED